MNFDYMQEVQPESEELKELVTSLYHTLQKAEVFYCSKPQNSGMLLRKATEDICHIYNISYQIGFPQSASLEDYLCYTSDEGHNVMVSRFLSVVRVGQRDRLEWLRVWGDECIFMDANPEEITAAQDKLYLNVKKMMVHMMEATKELCVRLCQLSGLEKYSFHEEILPGYISEEEKERLEEERQKEAKKGWFSFLKK